MPARSTAPDVKRQILKAFNAPGAATQLKALNADQHTRLVRRRRPDVIEIGADAPDMDHIAPPPGSVMMLVAPKGDAMLKELGRAYRAGDAATLKQIGTRLRDIAARRKVRPLSTAVKQLMAAPVYFDLLYGSKTLAPNVALINGIEFGSLVFAYNGGMLDDSLFSVTEYHRADAESDADILLVKRPPKLSRVERDVLGRVPVAVSDINIGSTAACPYWTAVVVVVFVVVTVAGKTCGNFLDRLSIVSLPETTIRKIGAVASARELLNMRRQVFEEYGV